MKLINKAPELQNEDQQWEIPLDGTEGFVKEKSTGKVLGLSQKRDCSYGALRVKLQTRGKSKGNCNVKSDAEKWLRSKSDDQGWFTLKNQENGRLLTAQTKTKFKLTGMLLDQFTLTRFIKAKQ